MKKIDKDDTIKSVTVEPPYPQLAKHTCLAASTTHGSGGHQAVLDVTPVASHSGKKYLRKIYPADGVGAPILVDVYEVSEAFAVTGGPLNHALKKILCPGQRGKGGRAQDIKEAIDALSRAYEMELRGGKEGV
jgi:hypothetical protein